MNKTAIKKFAIEARKKLMASVSDKAGMIGITEKDFQKEPISKGADFEIYKTAAGTEVTLNKSQCEQRKLLVKQMEERGFDAVIEEVAYTWFNRICAIRFMEVNDYLPTRVRVLSSEKDGKTEPDIVTQALEIDLGLTDKEKEEVLDLKLKSDPQSQDELFKKVFIKQCNKLHEALPELFEETEDYTEMLLSLSYTNKDEVIYMLVNTETGIAEADFNVTTVGGDGEVSGQVEIIGWLYQYYISEKHDEVVNVRKKSPIEKQNLPAATQIFTPDWVVKYMVQNSLGKTWCLSNENSRLQYNMQFYINTKEDVQLVNSPEKIKFIDPCMGSGHILIYAFDVFMEIYRECGYSDRDAASAILKNNLYGIDVDKRAYQLAYFSLMMKARQYNRRIFSLNIELNLIQTVESNELSSYDLRIIDDSQIRNEIYTLLRKFEDAQEYGSLLMVDKEVDDLRNYLDEYKLPDEYNLIEYNFKMSILPALKKLVRQSQLLCGKYDVVCTNPPYLNKYNKKLEKYIIENFPESKGDMYSAFIERNLNLCKQNGFSAMMTPHGWMFTKSYEKLRKMIIERKSMSSVIHMAKGAFYSEAAVDICSFVIRNNNSKLPAKYIRLEDFKGDMELQKQKVIEGIKDKNCNYIYECSTEQFERIEGNPFSYWVTENVYLDFEKGIPLKMIAPPRQGMATTNNDLFLRMWYEIDFDKIGFGMKNEDESASSGKRYFPYNKGGEFRRWYGNNYYVVNFENHGKEVCDYIDIACAPKFNHKNRVINRDYYFLECITWSDISADFSGRYCPEGFIFDIKGSSGFPPKEKVRYILGLLNSKLTQAFIDILNPTITTQVGDMARIPVIYGDEKLVNELVDECVNMSKDVWDSSEISWEFKRNALIAQREKSIHNAYIEMTEKQKNDREKMISYEIKLNEEFINIYGLKDYLNYKLNEESIGVIVQSKEDAIKQFISYSIGCMFGRYSLDVDGLMYAGSIWDESKYQLFVPDADNIIPITDEEYFSDDVVGRFIDFLKVVYGESTLEENLDFIANAINGKGATSREIIRNYFIKDFFADHCKIYQKRPIYWLFDSGKENGFKALVYLHRYDADTVGRVRTDYLHKQQGYVESALRSAEYTIDNSSSSSEKSKATKAVAKYTKQLAEMKLYDEAIAHIANQRIDLDLDDGVKVNYEKFQGIEVSREGQKAVKIDLLAKIK